MFFHLVFSFGNQIVLFHLVSSCGNQIVFCHFWLLVVTFGCFLLLLLHALAWDYLKTGKEQHKAKKRVAKSTKIVEKSDTKR